MSGCRRRATDPDDGPRHAGAPRTHTYLRNGTLDLFAALNIATGAVIARGKPQHRAQDFVRFLQALETHADAELEVHVVLDNLATHKGAARPSLAPAASAVSSPLHTDVWLLAISSSDSVPC